MAAQLPIKETVDASDAVFSSKTPSDAELSFDDKRRSSPTKRANGDREQGLLQSEYRNATEMACSSTLRNGGVEDNDVDNTGDWKTTLGGNPNRFHPLWGPPIPRKGMTMTIGNGNKSEKIEWDPFFGPPVMKSRGVPKLTKAVEEGGDRSRVGLMANYHWEGLENGSISSPALLVPQRQQPYQIGAPPGGGMMMNPQQQQQQQQQQHHLQQQLQMMTQQLQQQQANGQPVTPQQQQQYSMMQQQYQLMMQHQQQQHPQYQQPMNPQQQQQMMMQQMQRQQQQSGGQPFTPQQQQMMMQQMQHQQGGMQQQQPNNGNLANQQQQPHAQPQQQQQPPPVVDQREPYSVPLSAQSSLGLELDNVVGGNAGGGSVGSAVSSSLDVDDVTARRVGTSPPSHSNQVDDDDL